MCIFVAELKRMDFNDRLKPIRMKKRLLPLMTIGLLLACSGQPNKEEDENSLLSRFNSTMNIHESVVKNADGTVTYQAVEWGGLIGTVKEHNLPVDWSEYESVTIDFATPPKVETQLLVSDKYKAYGKAGISSLTCNFDGQDVSSIDEVTLQAATPGTIVVKDVRLTPVTTNWKKVPLRTVACTFGNWQDGFTLQPDLFAQAHQGDKLEFLYTTDTSNPELENWLIKTIYGGTETTFEGNDNALNKWGCAPVGRRSTVYRIPLTAKDVANLKKKGAFVNGLNLNVTQVNLLQVDESVAESVADSVASF